MTTEFNRSGIKTESLPGLAAAYAEKQEGYFENERPEMLELIPASARRVLDVGCGTGVFGQILKEKIGCEVWGVEPDLKSSQRASAKLDRVVHGCFDENIGLPSGHFDCVVFNDVLEHMVEPAAALRMAKNFMVPAGKIVASIPNLTHFPTLWRLVVRGQWEYTERGILDRTHLRFFTRRSINQLFEDAGFTIERLTGINEFCRIQPDDARFWKIYRILSLWPGWQIREMRYLQFAVVAGQNSRLKT